MSSLEWIEDYPYLIEWKMPEWMYQFLDMLPSMGDVRKEEQIRLIEGLKSIIEIDIIEDEKITDVESLKRVNILAFVHGKVNLLLDLYGEGKLKLG